MHVEMLHLEPCLNFFKAMQSLQHAIKHFNICNCPSIIAMHISWRRPRPRLPSSRAFLGDHKLCSATQKLRRSWGNNALNKSVQTHRQDLFFPVICSSMAGNEMTRMSSGNVDGMEQGAKINRKKNDDPRFLYRCIGTSRGRRQEAAKQISRI